MSLWFNKSAVTEPETILTQMISFLEAEEMNIRTKINTGSSAEHPTGRKGGGMAGYRITPVLIFWT